MKIFNKIRKQYAILGICSSKQLTQKHPFNNRVLVGFLLFGCGAASKFAYIFYTANDFMEYMVWICSTSGAIIVFICYAAIVFKQILLFESIDNMERLIDSSEIQFLLISNTISF